MNGSVRRRPRTTLRTEPYYAGASRGTTSATTTSARRARERDEGGRQEEVGKRDDAVPSRGMTTASRRRTKPPETRGRGRSTEVFAATMGPTSREIPAPVEVHCKVAAVHVGAEPVAAPGGRSRCPGFISMVGGQEHGARKAIRAIRQRSTAPAAMVGCRRTSRPRLERAGAALSTGSAGQQDMHGPPGGHDHVHSRREERHALDDRAVALEDGAAVSRPSPGARTRSR